MFYVVSEDIEGTTYSFEPASDDIQEVKNECQELLETLDGGHFDIYDSDTDEFIDYVEW